MLTRPLEGVFNSVLAYNQNAFNIERGKEGFIIHFVFKLILWIFYINLASELSLGLGFAHAFTSLTPMVDSQREFWIRIYSQTSEEEMALHDARVPGLIYEVVSTKGLSIKSKSTLLKQTREKWINKLEELHEKYLRNPSTTGWNEEDVKIYSALKPLGGSFLLEATKKKRMRFQQGQKESFLQAWNKAGRYIKDIENIFDEEEVPKELSRLPYIESGFNLRALSLVGASGIWQFMKSTASRYLMINSVIDERWDPILAARAAAQLLKENFSALGSWPLAVTAYNHGRKPLVRALIASGYSNLEDLIRYYHGPGFGFSSKNFYASLLAIHEIEKTYSQDATLAEVRHAPWERVSAVLPKNMKINSVAKLFKMKKSTLIDFNPALSRGALRGEMILPKGTKIWIERNDKKNE